MMREMIKKAYMHHSSKYDVAITQFRAIPIRSALILCFAAFLLDMIFPPAWGMSQRFLRMQDRWLLLVQACLIAIIFMRSAKHNLLLPLSWRWVLVLVGSVLGLIYAGHYWILAGYNMSRDEQMAVFDTQIFSGWRLVQPLPQIWQGHADALNLKFMLPVEQPVAWISAYLPVHSMIRSIVGLATDTAVSGALFTAVGAFALWKCTRLIWPEDRDAGLIATLLYLGSGQVIISGMSAYSMPAHLALNLLWLWCFLINKRSIDILALLIGFFATGLHQPLFHPLFVAPFILIMLHDRNWRRAAIFIAGYAAICWFWMAWPIWMKDLVVGSQSVTAIVGTDYLSRLIQALQRGNDARWANMGANLLRFFAWQHMLLLPLVGLGFTVIRREPLVAALAASLVLPIFVFLLILPAQGHGFGYRYLHGLIGSAILIAMFGWKKLAPGHAGLRTPLLLSTLGGFLLVLPIQAWMAHSFYAPFAAADRQIENSRADYFIIGDQDSPYSGDLVINRADLSNRPIRLLAEHVDEDLLRRICNADTTVALPASSFLHRIERYFQTSLAKDADQRFALKRRQLEQNGCRVSMLG
jgi:hypothetical protein